MGNFCSLPKNTSAQKGKTDCQKSSSRENASCFNRPNHVSSSGPRLPQHWSTLHQFQMFWNERRMSIVAYYTSVQEVACFFIANIPWRQANGRYVRIPKNSSWTRIVFNLVAIEEVLQCTTVSFDETLRFLLICVFFSSFLHISR